MILTSNVLLSRERNRLHARNTRERKKAEMELMQLRVESLQKEKEALGKKLVDTTVADILLSLSSNNPSSQDTISDDHSVTTSMDHGSCDENGVDSHELSDDDLEMDLQPYQRNTSTGVTGDCRQSR